MNAGASRFSALFTITVENYQIALNYRRIPTFTHFKYVTKTFNEVVSIETTLRDKSHASDDKLISGGVMERSKTDNLIITGYDYNKYEDGNASFKYRVALQSFKIAWSFIRSRIC